MIKVFKIKVKENMRTHDNYIMKKGEKYYAYFKFDGFSRKLIIATPDSSKNKRKILLDDSFGYLPYSVAFPPEEVMTITEVIYVKNNRELKDLLNKKA